MKNINSEDPKIHWEYVNVENKTVLDLGCGDFGNVNNLPYLSTIDYFILKGANHVIGVDSNFNDTSKILERYKDQKVTILNKSIESTSDIESLILENKPDIIKSDIEGAEIYLFMVDDSVFSTISEYYIETHNTQLYDMCIDKLNKCNYNIIEQLSLDQTEGTCKVIFAKK